MSATATAAANAAKARAAAAKAQTAPVPVAAAPVAMVEPEADPAPATEAPKERVRRNNADIIVDLTAKRARWIQEHAERIAKLDAEVLRLEENPTGGSGANYIEAAQEVLATGMTAEQIKAQLGKLLKAARGLKAMEREAEAAAAATAEGDDPNAHQ